MTKTYCSAGEISVEMMARIREGLTQIRNGQIILIAQDARLVQIELHETIRTADFIHTGGYTPPTAEACARWEACIRRAFRILSFGQLTVVLKNGAVKQIDRTIKNRLPGLYGDGI